MVAYSAGVYSGISRRKRASIVKMSVLEPLIDVNMTNNKVLEERRRRGLCKSSATSFLVPLPSVPDGGTRTHSPPPSKSPISSSRTPTQRNLLVGTSSRPPTNMAQNVSRDPSLRSGFLPHSAREIFIIHSARIMAGASEA